MQNKFNLPPDMFSLVCERAEDPLKARDVYDALLNEVQIQLDESHREPQDAAFIMIAQYALILNDIAQKVAVDEGIICSECFEPLEPVEGDEGYFVCENRMCKLWLKHVKRAVR
jgi:hypothetical protein